MELGLREAEYETLDWIELIPYRVGRWDYVDRAINLAVP
jgi:hypothetical protein